MAWKNSKLLLLAASLPLSGLNIEDFEAVQSKELKWESNPFVQPVDNASVHDLKLTAIIYREGDSACLINSQILKEGDKIGLAQVVDISPQRVILRHENGIFRLRLKGSETSSK